MSEIQHGSAVKPISIPVLADVDPDNIDRCQSLSGGSTQPSEFVYEEGREDKLCTDKGTLETKASIGQLEYGTINFFLQLANLASEPSGGLSLSDFSDAKLDIYQPGKDEYNGTVDQTLWLSNMVLDSLTIDMPDPDSRITRTFELSGSKYKMLRESQKYLIFKTNDAPTGTSGSYNITLSDPAPVEDPNNSGVYILKLYRIRSGTATELTLSTDYTFTHATNTLTITSASAGDHYRIWYSANSYGTSGDPFVANDSDLCFIKGNSITATLSDGTHSAVELTKLTSLSISATDFAFSTSDSR